jgi:uncharacterized membrane protein
VGSVSSAKWKSASFLSFMLLFQFAAIVTVIFDIPVARQVICFGYFTFVPGFIFLKILKLHKLDLVEIILFSVGLSVAFLMLSGLLTNELSLLIGFSEPLSTLSIMVVFNCLIFLGLGIAHRQKADAPLLENWQIETPPMMSLLLLSIPILSIVGAIYVNVYNTNLILLYAIVSISLLFAFGVLSKRLFPSKLFPFAVILIAIALLYQSSLVSNYIIPFGSDVPGEYLLFKFTQSNAHWSSVIPFTGFSKYNDMLSITILPTIYANLLNIGTEWVFKLLFPLIFSFVALGLYQTWQPYLGKKYAFISAFLLMSQVTFYTEMLGLNRQMIAELFLVLLLLVILSKKMKPVNKLTFFVIFSFALVVSHYAVAAIFLFLITFALISLFIAKRSDRNITISMVIFLGVIMFTWYIYTAKAVTFNSFLESGNYVSRRLGDFLNPQSRGTTVMTGLGLAESPSVLNTFGRMFSYATQALIVLGFVGLVTKRAKIHFEREQFIFTIVAMILLISLLLVPGLANTLNMTRFYHILLFFLAPLFVVGADFVAGLLVKRRKELAVTAILLIVLVPYFLFQTNFVYEVTGGDSWSIPLSGYRMNYLRLYGESGYVDSYSAYGAQWLSKVNFNNSALYADERARDNVLTIYGILPEVRSLSNTTIVENNSVVYLDTLNVVGGLIPFGEFLWNSSELSPIFNNLNLIYSNGGNVIYRNSP